MQRRAYSESCLPYRKSRGLTGPPDTLDVVPASDALPREALDSRSKRWQLRARWHGTTVTNDVEAYWSGSLARSRCPDPYRTILDQLSRAWVEGTLSNEELAFQIVETQAEIRSAKASARGAEKTTVDDPLVHLDVLADAMLAASDQDEATAYVRREILRREKAALAARERGGR